MKRLGVPEPKDDRQVGVEFALRALVEIGIPAGFGFLKNEEVGGIL